MVLRPGWRPCEQRTGSACRGPQCRRRASDGKCVRRTGATNTPPRASKRGAAPAKRAAKKVTPAAKRTAKKSAAAGAADSGVSGRTVENAINALDIYSKQPFLGKSEEMFRNYNHLHAVHDTFLVVPDPAADILLHGDDGAVNMLKSLIHAHLCARVPIFHRGKHRWNGVKQRAYKAWTRNLECVRPAYASDAPEPLLPMEAVRYGILGPAVVVHNTIETIWVLHLWGVDLEAWTPRSHAVDAQTMRQYENPLDWIYTVLVANAQILKRSVNTASECFHHVHLPGVGLGAGLRRLPEMVAKCLPGEDPDNVRGIVVQWYYAQMLQAVFEGFHSMDVSDAAMYVTVPQHDMGNPNKTLIYRFDRTQAHVPVPMAEWEGGAVHGPLPLYTHNYVAQMMGVDGNDVKTLTLNAWNARSFIGNQGTSDDGLGGWMVTGAANFKNRGFDWPENTSYLHNTAVFSPASTEFVL